MSKEMMKQADDWLKSMLEIASEQKEADMIEHMKERIKVQKWLMEQAEQNIKRTKKHADLNWFLQNNMESKDVSSVVGKSVIDVAMHLIKEQAKQVEMLAKERNEYKSALSEMKKFPTYMTKGQYVARGIKISNKVLRKWNG